MFISYDHSIIAVHIRLFYFRLRIEGGVYDYLPTLFEQMVCRYASSAACGPLVGAFRFKLVWELLAPQTEMYGHAPPDYMTCHSHAATASNSCTESSHWVCGMLESRSIIHESSLSPLRNVFLRRFNLLIPHGAAFPSTLISSLLLFIPFVLASLFFVASRPISKEIYRRRAGPCWLCHFFGPHDGAT